MPEWRDMPRHARWLPLRLRQRVDGRRLQREHRRLCQCSLSSWCHLPRSRGLVLLRVSSWAHRYDSRGPSRIAVQTDRDLNVLRVNVILCLQVCCATLMTPASATHAKRAPTVTPTQLMARQYAPAPRVILDQPATWILMSAL